jgi:hypothetical protein
MEKSDFQPLARVMLRWLSPEKGGRRSVPPGPIFAATARFQGQLDEQPGDLSIVIRYRGSVPAFGVDFDAEIGFLAPELAMSWLVPGVQFTVMEGSRSVAEGVVNEAYRGQAS